MKIFISGPYSQGDVAQNVKKAMDLAGQLIDMGHSPFCPHLFHFLHINSPKEYSTWLNTDIEFLSVCDAMIRIQGDSKGADVEEAFAKDNNIPIYHNISEIK